MRVAYNDQDTRAGLRGYVQLNKYTHTHTHARTTAAWRGARPLNASFQRCTCTALAEEEKRRGHTTSLLTTTLQVCMPPFKQPLVPGNMAFKVHHIGDRKLRLKERVG